MGFDIFDFDMRYGRATYQTGVQLTKLAMAEVEAQIQRLICLEREGEPLNLDKWFVDITDSALGTLYL
jgi:hypothetical protein